MLFTGEVFFIIFLKEFIALHNRISRFLFLDLPVIAGDKTETGQKNPSSFLGTLEGFQRITYSVTLTDKLIGFD